MVNKEKCTCEVHSALARLWNSVGENKNLQSDVELMETVFLGGKDLAIQNQALITFLASIGVQTHVMELPKGTFPGSITPGPQRPQ